MENDAITDAEIEALFKEGPTDGEGHALPLTEPKTGTEDGKQTDGSQVQGSGSSSTQNSSPVEVKLPAELLAQGGALAELAQKYLGDNSAALKAITDRLAAPPPRSETKEEKDARIQGLVTEFLTDPEAAIAKLVKQPAPAQAINKDELMAPAYEAKGELLIDAFLKEMRDNDELGLDPKVAKAVETEFKSFTASQSKEFGSYERYIGSIPKDKARETLNNVYMRALGVRIAADTKEQRRSQSTTTVTGGGSGSKGALTGISADKLAVAKATAAGLATGEDGKVNPDEYKQYLALALGR